MSRNDSRGSSNSAGRARPGLLRRGREAAVPSRSRWTCPDCGLASQDPVAARLGFCSRCNEFTGMCGAGRKIVSPDMMTVTSWHTPCTNLGVTAWQIRHRGIQRAALLCPEHDAQLRSGAATWIDLAVPAEE